jgi:hypothetical protein
MNSLLANCLTSMKALFHVTCKTISNISNFDICSFLTDDLIVLNTVFRLISLFFYNSRVLKLEQK